MSRCRVGPRKVKSKIAPLVPIGMTIIDALTNRGNHYVSVGVRLDDGTQRRGSVNYHTGEPFDDYGDSEMRSCLVYDIPGTLVAPDTGKE